MQILAQSVAVAVKNYELGEEIFDSVEEAIRLCNDSWAVRP